MQKLFVQVEVLEDVHVDLPILYHDLKWLDHGLDVRLRLPSLRKFGVELAFLNAHALNLIIIEEFEHLAGVLDRLEHGFGLLVLCPVLGATPLLVPLNQFVHLALDHFAATQEIIQGRVLLMRVVGDLRLLIDLVRNLLLANDDVADVADVQQDLLVLSTWAIEPDFLKLKLKVHGAL